jgi:isoquinoline 1-oxidoreductase beta subunit
MTTMDPKTIVNLSRSRRAFLTAGGAAGAGLVLGVHLTAKAQMGGPGRAGSATEAAAFSPNAFVRIGRDNTVTVFSKHLEMGQGVYTGLATLVAEELDAGWNQMRVEGAPADATRFNNLFWGPVQGTGGSTSLANSWDQLRQAGAAARAMLVGAAAKQWNVAPETIRVTAGVLSHPSGKRATFGELAEAAAAQPVPASPTLKVAKDYVYIG